jgi:hypothetical protein
MEIPNLDAMSQEELRAYCDYFSILEKYCLLKDSAITGRLEGNIACALSLESKCDALYDSLPKQYQW